MSEAIHEIKQATVVVHRKGYDKNPAFKYHIFLDDKEQAHLGFRQEKRFYLDSGNHTLQIVCPGMGQVKSSKIKLYVEAGQQIILVAGTPQTFNWKGLLTSFSLTPISGGITFFLLQKVPLFPQDLKLVVLASFVLMCIHGLFLLNQIPGQWLELKKDFAQQE